MPLTIDILPGPPSHRMTRSAAEKSLRRSQDFPKGAEVALEQVNGQWIAAVVHQAGPFDGPPADDSEESAGPKSEGPDDTAPSPDDSGPPPDSDSDSGESGPPKHDKGKGKGGEAHELSQALDLLTQIAEALGLPVGMGDSMVPGGDPGAAPPGPGGPPPGLGGPPPGGPPPGPGGPGGPPGAQHMIHQRAMKPGETPPGGTPVGAPAFAHVNPTHPWAHVAGEIASFEVCERIGNAPLANVEAQLQELARTSGYKVSRFGEGTDADGFRVARALISAH